MMRRAVANGWCCMLRRCLDECHLLAACHGQVINHRLPNGGPEMWEQAVDFDTKKVRRRGHYVVDRKQQRVSLTAEGMHRALRAWVRMLHGCML